MIEGIALHHYSVIDWDKKGSATGFSQQEYFTTMQARMENGRTGNPTCSHHGQI